MNIEKNSRKWHSWLKISIICGVYIWHQIIPDEMNTVLPIMRLIILLNATTCIGYQVQQLYLLIDEKNLLYQSVF